MRPVVTRVVLAGSGAILGLIGGALMLKPKLFLAINEAIVDYDPSLMSEVTAPTGILLITGAFMMLGAVNLRFANKGLLYGAIVYGSYGVSRLVSRYLHGLPSEQLIVATQFELGIAALLIALRMDRVSNEREISDSNFEKAVI